MGTANFMNHENGIFVLEMQSYEDALQMLLENGHEEDDIDEEMIQIAIEDDYYWYVDGFMDEMLIPTIEDKGYYVSEHKDGRYTVWSTGKYSDRIVAELRLESGYYSHVQLIVETDGEYLIENYVGWYTGTKTEMLENWTPHNKRLFKIIEQFTRKLNVVARFSNGETFYE